MLNSVSGFLLKQFLHLHTFHFWPRSWIMVIPFLHTYDVEFCFFTLFCFFTVSSLFLFYDVEFHFFTLMMLNSVSGFLFTLFCFFTVSSLFLFYDVEFHFFTLMMLNSVSGFLLKQFLHLHTFHFWPRSWIMVIPFLCNIVKWQSTVIVCDNLTFLKLKTTAYWSFTKN